MRLARDFRSMAREALNGKWMIAVLVGLVATILGAVGDMAPEVNFSIEGGNANASLEFAGQTIFSTNGGISPEIGVLIAGGITYIMIAALILGAIYFILGSVIGVGYAKFNLNLVDRLDGNFDNLFAYVNYWKTIAKAKLIQCIYIFLWSLLLVIPGIIASYSYAMTEYILAENPELSAREAIAMSKEMMKGNRWRMFCLGFSFIGWSILCAFTLGIGNLWLTPYKEAAFAAFYREVSGTEMKTEETFDW